MNFLKHFTGQPFVLATGIAALIHSTWSLGTLFSGQQPAVENIVSLIDFVHFIGWLLPAFLIAIALDIGQIATSNEIREHGVTIGRIVTFTILALSTYYLQWLYIVYHIPQLEIGFGVADYHQWIVDLIRNAAIWIIPLFLPLATTLHTITGNTGLKPRKKQHGNMIEQIVEDMPLLPIENETNVAVCPDCGWNSGIKESEGKARQALTAHKLHCEVK